MLEILLLFGVIIIILTFFYKQAVCEFRINQMEWTQKENIHSLLHEKIPLVVRGLPPATIWTHQDVLTRSCFQDLPIFQEMNLQEWIASTSHDTICPWKDSQAEKIGSVCGISIWSKKWVEPVLLTSFLRWWISPIYQCWAGRVGLKRLFATWTVILPVDGAIIVSILPESVESSLPVPWLGCFPSELTPKDTPFLSDIKFIDIVVRPGNALIMPPHWFVSWIGESTTSSKAPMVCTLSYHSPISRMAFRASPFTL